MTYYICMNLDMYYNLIPTMCDSRLYYRFFPVSI